MEDKGSMIVGIVVVILFMSFIGSCNSKDKSTPSGETKSQVTSQSTTMDQEEFDQLICQGLLYEYAMNFTNKDSEKLCELMFTNEMIRHCFGVYYTNMNLKIAQRNVAFKSTIGELLEKVNYSFTDVTFHDISKDQIDYTTNYYKEIFGYDVDILDGYVVKAKFSSSEGYAIDMAFPVVNIDKEGWKIPPTIWECIFGDAMDRF